MKKRYSFFYTIILFMLLFTLSGCNTSSKDDMFQSKLQSEIDFFETEIFSITIKYAKGEYDKEDNQEKETTNSDIKMTSKELNWDGIYSEISKLNLSWDSVALDLNKKKISQDEINKLSSIMSNLIISITNKNQNEMFNLLNDMYAMLPNIEKNFSNDTAIMQKRVQKSIILSSYRYCVNGDFENALKTANNAKENYLKLMDDSNYVKENIYSLNKVYVGIEEFLNSIQTQNMGLINLKFINLIEEI